MKSNILCLSLIIFFFASCDKKTSKQAGREGDGVIAVDIERDDKVSVFDYFSHIEVIPLETRKESVMNPRIEKFLVYKDHYYCFDKKQMLIFVFDLSGKYVKTINKQGNGPGEYKTLYDFSFNRFSGNLELMDAWCRILVYDESGEDYKETIRLPDSETTTHYYTQLTPDIYIFINPFRVQENKMFFFSKSKNEIIYETYDNYPDYMGKTSFGFSKNPFYIVNDTVCFSQLYNGDVYAIDKESMKLLPRYLFDFKEHNFTIADIPRDETIEYYLQFRNYVSNKYATFFMPENENPDYFFSRFYFKQKAKHILIDKKKHEIKVFNTFTENIQCFAEYIDKEAMYAVTTYDKLDFVVKPELLDVENARKLESVNEESNQVIVKFYFK
ncbi:MAG: 6-bladed beta-propeller [Dysgonamonadaceae bacterium]|jgi:hypothetical protein|nr:6-bladed beta-propeller [Dysgonamonadaceae bacterium]